MPDKVPNLAYIKDMYFYEIALLLLLCVKVKLN